jgi:glucose/mannose-6-phosphate isomerase
VNENTLVICSSYSGNTEETLSALDHALEKKAQICGITTGGDLAERLHSLHKDVVKIPAGLQPRAALAFSFVPMIKLLKKAGIISSSLDDWIQEAVHTLKEVRKTYSKDRDTNPVYHLAERVKDRIPVIYADSSTLGVAAVRLKGQLAENSKILAWYNELPELNHNEIVGWENNADIFQRLFVLWLMDRDDHERVQHRQEITRTLLQEAGVDQIAISVPGNLFQERFLHMIHYGDWLSYWCAILYGTDPSPVVKIAHLKQELADRK